MSTPPEGDEDCGAPRNGAVLPEGFARRIAARQPRRTIPHAVVYPHAGLIAPQEDKVFVKGVVAYLQGRHQEAVDLFRNVSTRPTSGAHVSEEFFGALSLLALGRIAEAIAPLEIVVASHMAIPDELMTKYGVGGHVSVPVTSMTTAELPMSSFSAALLLVELYQHEGRLDDAIRLLESLGAVSGQAILALSLAGDQATDQVGRSLRERRSSRAQASAGVVSAPRSMRSIRRGSGA